MNKVALDQEGNESSLSDQVGQARNKNAISRKQQSNTRTQDLSQSRRPFPSGRAHQVPFLLLSVQRNWACRMLTATSSTRSFCRTEGPELAIKS